MDWTASKSVLPVQRYQSARSSSIASQVGFNLDHHTRNEHMDVAQLTPPGSGCSIVFGDSASAKPNGAGSMKALQLVVSDATQHARSCSIAALR